MNNVNKKITQILICTVTAAVFSCMLAFAKDSFIVKNSERDLLNAAGMAQLIVVAEYVGYSFYPPGIEKKHNASTNIQVKTSYNTIRVLKGPIQPPLIFLRSQYNFHDPKKNKGNWIVFEGLEPDKGSKWILFLKDSNPIFLKREGYSSLIANYTYGIECTQENLKKTIEILKK